MADHDIDKAAQEISNLAISLSTLQSYCLSAQSDDEYRNFHGLMLDMIPLIGARLDHAIRLLGRMETGAFPEITINGGVSCG